MSYRLSVKAEEDVISIFLAGMEQLGLHQAERYHEQLTRCFDFLADNPLVAHERFEIAPPVRIHPFGAHLIGYGVDGHGNVFIVRVRHAHEDWQQSSDITPAS